MPRVLGLLGCNAGRGAPQRPVRLVIHLGKRLDHCSRPGFLFIWGTRQAGLTLWHRTEWNLRLESENFEHSLTHHMLGYSGAQNPIVRSWQVLAKRMSRRDVANQGQSSDTT